MYFESLLLYYKIIFLGNCSPVKLLFLSYIALMNETVYDVVDRTWPSLRNRYLRYILPRLGALALPPARTAALRAAAAAGTSASSISLTHLLSRPELASAIYILTIISLSERIMWIFLKYPEF